MKFLNIAVLTTLLNSPRHIQAQSIGDVCLKAITDQYNSLDLLEATAALFENIQQVSNETTASTIVPIRDFTIAQNQGTQHAKMKDACEGMGNSLCHVSTRVQYQDSTEAVEIMKPVCFPSTCQDEDIEFMDPEPLFCEKDSSCEVVSRDVVCPSRQVYFNSNCTADYLKVATNSSITKRETNLQNKMDGECMNVLYGKESRWCSFNTSHPIESVSSDSINVIRDFSELTGSTFKTMKQECENLGHSLCTVDSKVMSGQTFVYDVSKPVCVPNTCMLDDVALIDPFPASCTSDDVDCNVVEQVITCGVNATFGQSGDCETDLGVIQAEDSIIHTKQQNLVRRIEDNCLDVLYGDSKTSCSIISRKSVNDTLVVGYPDESNEYFENFSDACYGSSANSEVCVFDAELKYDSQDFERNVEGYSNFVGYPLCLPNPDMCPEKEKKNFVESSILMTKDECMSANGDCDITVKSHRCMSRVTETPTLEPTLSPSALPTIMQSDAPSVKPSLRLSSEPSVTISTSPSQHPSSTPSTVPSLAPSSSLTTEPTLSAESDSLASASASSTESLSSGTTRLLKSKVLSVVLVVIVPFVML